jgi:hypothetical protein
MTAVRADRPTFLLLGGSGRTGVRCPSFPSAEKGVGSPDPFLLPIARSSNLFISDQLDLHNYAGRPPMRHSASPAANSWNYDDFEDSINFSKVFNKFPLIAQFLGMVVD